MQRKLFFFYSFLITLPQISLAHVKWFAEPVREVSSYRFNDIWVISWILICSAVIGLGVYFERKISVPNWVIKISQKYGDLAHTICSIGIGLSLILFSYNGYIFAPNLPLQNSLGTALLVLQALVGGIIVLGFFVRVASVLLLALFVFGIIQNGFVEMLDTLEILGISIYLFIAGRAKWSLGDFRLLESLTKKLTDFSVPLLRVFVGLNLIILGFSEKILNPSLTQSFLSEYHWNFMQNMGFLWFTDYWFAFSAGVAESLIGVFLVLGLLTRLTTLALAGFLVTTLILLGPVELIGHLPHFSIAIVFLVFGSGNKLKI
ncbi:MAG: DoxX family membrane protein [Minisyncoccia bacterium]